MGYALFAQYVQNLEPCPLCIFQRVAVIALGVVFLLAALQNPAGWGRLVYGGLGLLAGAVGAGVRRGSPAFEAGLRETVESYVSPTA